ncbi:RagB/SusD family nutrient uptake outer membrane protein [Dysgonomonas sp. 25]|uniref:RagB/SusD family nutrient uptake outer membrane protein n=1 Tax=Dysgonomonas sp. 25 TaxID=2302933 RepID=UPI0013D5F52C|nr:RagB/SusD family nutrient uptake outer membrane protein [Dysgonomonas sp. 25]NDV70155.1 RagB/SusD family nutrient uptake outer membrane protein [Dysgonomonas sp. 25]
MRTFSKYILGILAVAILSTGCSDYLDQSPNKIYTDDQVFADVSMINSAKANLYGRVNWGPSLDDNGGHALIDEAAYSSGGINRMDGYDGGWWRVWDYGLIRDINVFIQGCRSQAALNNTDLDDDDRKMLEGEARFIRAWTYFNMCKGLGGVPIVENHVFEWTSNTDVTTMQIPRSTEAATYDYIIAECDSIANYYLAGFNKPDDDNASRATKWAALALKARAAIYAGSIAKYNAIHTPSITLPGGEVGIAASAANGYYTKALAAAEEIITTGPYRLYDENTNKGRNFYELFNNKKGNPEVIWSLDYYYPGKTNGFTRDNMSSVAMADGTANAVTPILNVVEDFEYINNRDGKLKIRDAMNNYIYYTNAEDLFANKDPRLYGTIIYPGADFRNIKIEYQAGQKYMDGGVWKERTGNRGEIDGTYGLITSINGPVTNDAQNVNKTGFNIRKFVSEDKDAATIGRGSDVWFVRFRYAEVLLIAAEAALELGQPQALGYINQVRTRAGINPLTTLTIDDIVQERRVEFVYENHRYWDLKRFRLAHTIWDGNVSNEKAVHYSLYPYKINDASHPQNGKWVFDKVKTFTTEYPRKFRLQNYYNFFDQDWLNKNPKLVKNPYQ